MKKTWSILCLAALVALPLAGCAGDRTGSDMGGATASPSQAIHSNMPGGDEDLAGSDGVVGGSGAGNTGNGDATGRADDSALEEMERGVRNTLDDLGSAARRMGEDARRAIEG